MFGISKHIFYLEHFFAKKPVYQAVRQCISWVGHRKINKFHTFTKIIENSYKNTNNVKCLLHVSNEQNE